MPHQHHVRDLEASPELCKKRAHEAYVVLRRVRVAGAEIPHTDVPPTFDLGGHRRHDQGRQAAKSAAHLPAHRRVLREARGAVEEERNSRRCVLGRNVHGESAASATSMVDVERFVGDDVFEPMFFLTPS